MAEIRDFQKQPVTKAEKLGALDEAIRRHRSRGPLSVGSVELEALCQIRGEVERDPNA